MELLQRFCSWLQLIYVGGYSEGKLPLSLLLSLSPPDECRTSPCKRLLHNFQDVNNGLGSVSKPLSSDEAVFQFQRTRSQNSAYLGSKRRTDGVCTQEQEQGCWATVHPELLRHIMHKVDECRSTWPSRIDVFNCASVCRSWREAVKDVVKRPELLGRLTFPISLKQPGPQNSLMQCFLKRDRSSSTFYLYIGSTTKLTESGKFLLAARKILRATSWNYIISLNFSEFSLGGHNYVGKLRSNCLGTKFTVYESPSSESSSKLGHLGTGRRPNRFSYQSLPQSFNVAQISYELNVVGINGPRQMECILYSAPVSCVTEGGSAHSKDSLASPCRSESAHNTDATERELVNDASMEYAPLMLRNKLPRWHNHLECWCLNFKGRVTVASVKNFQLVAAKSLQYISSQLDHDQVLLQFGKVGKDLYTMDFKYPLSAFQAFAICLSSFDMKGGPSSSVPFHQDCDLKRRPVGHHLRFHGV